MREKLAVWNVASTPCAQAEILPCNGSESWAEELCALRPFANEAELFTTSDHVWRVLDRHAQQQAFDSHPRLGESDAKAGSAASLAWSHGEQSQIVPEDPARVELTAANRIYEAKFGHIFLLCATGKSTEEVLAALHKRLSASPEAEWAEAVEQQRLITQLRLRKWLGLPTPRCEDV